MFRKGHYGVSLLVFAPAGFALVRLGRPELAFVAGSVMLWFAMLPDLDHRIPGVPHRGPTHSLAFAGLVGAVFAAGGSLLGTAGSRLGVALDVSGVGLPVLGFCLGVVTVVAHLLGDALTPAGVNFLWPVSDYEYTLNLWRADNSLANAGLFVTGVFATVGSVYAAIAI
jgi:inner membrane protein